MKPVIVSGIKPTGRFHFGNYFGAMKQNIDLSQTGMYQPYIFIADYHALTSVQDGELLRSYMRDSVASYIACGLDPSSAVFFAQSDVPEHSELSLIFQNIVTMPYMMRAHAFKDAEAKNKEVNVGTFTYPILMAADILMYHAQVVPVGQDQKQHVEYARDIAGFFNRTWNTEYFTLPSERIMPEVAIIPGIDGAKMSKSYRNHIELFCDDESLKKTIMTIKTDSLRPEDPKDPETSIIYHIHKHFLDGSAQTKLRVRFTQGGYGYKEAKEDLLATIMTWRSTRKPIYDHLMSNPSEIDVILQNGKERASLRAKQTMQEVRRIVGLRE